MINNDKLYWKLIKELFRRVGVDEKGMDDFLAKHDAYNKNSKWYDEFSWTEKQQDDFKKWMISQLKGTKREKELTASMFLITYGWRIEQ